MTETTFQLNDEELLEVVKAAVKQALKEAKKEERRQQGKNKLHDTFQLMELYREVAISIEKSISEGDQLEIEGMSDHQKKLHIQSIRDSKIKSMLMLAQIDTMVDELKKKKEREGKQNEYDAFDMYFFQGMTYAEITEALSCGENTPRRWVNASIRELSTLLWGYDSVKAW